MNWTDISTQKSDKPLPPIAISYLRFSGLRQAKGDSVRRQTSGADDFTEVTGIEITEKLGDLGLSAYKNDHVKKGAFGEFLQQIETDEFQSKIKRRDVYLVVEAIHRMSRQQATKQIAQITSIVEAGVIVVTCKDGKVYNQNTINETETLLMFVLHAVVAHEQSKDKARMFGEMWKGKRLQAANGEIISNKHSPGWLCVSDDGKNWEQIPEAVKIVRQIFNWTAQGMGKNAISKKLNQTDVPTLSKVNKTKRANKHTMWSGSTIRYILESKAVIGTLTMKKGKEIVLEQENYYPAIIDEVLFAKVSKLRRAHPTNKGKGSKEVTNLFRKLFFDEETGEPIYVGGCYRRPVSKRYFMPKGAKLGKRRRKGAMWRIGAFEDIFFLTVQRALQVEGSTQKEEDALALVEVELMNTRKASGNLTEALVHLDGREISSITDKLAKLEDRKNQLLLDGERFREAILAGAGSLQLDPKETDRQKLCESIRMNVERIEMNCDKKRFWVKLMNGIEYRVTWNEKKGEIVLISKDFKPQKTILEWNPKTIGKKAQTEMVRTLQKPLKKA